MFNYGDAFFHDQRARQSQTEEDIEQPQSREEVRTSVSTPESLPDDYVFVVDSGESGG